MAKQQMVGIISRHIGECNSLMSSTVKSLDAIIINLEDEKCLSGIPENMS